MALRAGRKGKAEASFAARGSAPVLEAERAAVSLGNLAAQHQPDTGTAGFGGEKGHKIPAEESLMPGEGAAHNPDLKLPGANEVAIAIRIEEPPLRTRARPSSQAASDGRQVPRKKEQSRLAGRRGRPDPPGSRAGGGPAPSPYIGCRVVDSNEIVDVVHLR